jgi:polyferredoxin
VTGACSPPVGRSGRLSYWRVYIVTDLFVWLTTTINVILLAIALCLGLYVVTRTLRGWVTWLAGLMLWSLAGFYLYNALVVTTPAHRVLPWLKPCAVMALAFGFHLSILLPATRQEPGMRALYPPLRLPEWLERRLGTAGPVVRRLPVPLSYLLAIILITIIG